jgi:hypothetical protein
MDEDTLQQFTDISQQLRKIVYAVKHPVDTSQIILFVYLSALKVLSSLFYYSINITHFQNIST